MRTLALLLLLMNIAFFAWQQQFLPWLPWQPELLQPEPAQPYHPTLPKLVLLSEREAAKLPQIVPTVEKPKDEHLAKTEPPPEIKTPPVVVSPPIPTPAPPETASPAPEIQPHAPEPNTPVMAEKTVTPAETVPPLPPAQNESVSFQKLAMRLISQGKIFSSPPPPVQTIAVVNPPETPKVVATPTHAVETSQKTETTQKVEPPSSPAHEPKSVTEPSVVTDTAEKNKTLLSVPPTKTNKTEVVCYQIGHFSQLEEAQVASNWFKKKQIIAAPQKSDTRLATTTWLYLPAARSLQSVQATQKRLTQLGIADTVVINNPNGYIVSLGVYRDKTSVSQRLQELRSKGFDNIKAEERYATETKYWLNVKIVADSTTLLPQFQKAFKGLQVKTINCNDLR